jgi:hypothetical protein
MRNFLAGLKRWWQRRFRGYVPPPAGSGGTAWQQHPRGEVYFLCQCGASLVFSDDTYVIREQAHVEGCEGLTDQSTHTIATDKTRLMDLRVCSCPITDARYVKICPSCRRGHWKEGT